MRRLVWIASLALMAMGLILVARIVTNAEPEPRPHLASAVPAPQTVVHVPGPEPVQVPVLLYHHLTPRPEGANGAVISVTEFAQQMAWLKENGYTGIATADLHAWLSGQGRLPERPVLITFDDGYLSSYQYAYPILHQHQLRASIFLVSAMAGIRPGDLPYLNWAELRELQESGLIEVQAHSHNGHRQIDGQPALLAWSGDEVAADLRRLQLAFAGSGVPQPTAYAYPFGRYDGKVIAALREGGIQLGFTVKHGYVRKGDPLLELPRIIIYPGTSLCRFAQLVTEAPGAPCRQLTAARDDAQPLPPGP